MKPEELRIGNWVYAFKTEWQIDATDFSSDKIFTYKPLPITPEWLEKFGLKIIKDHDEVELLDFYFIDGFPVLDLLFWEDNTLEDADDKIQIQYVHQLQNLYYVLTGKELG
jgi:hypothetical protein